MFAFWCKADKQLVNSTPNYIRLRFIKKANNKARKFNRLLSGRPGRQTGFRRRQPALPEDFLSKLAVEVRLDQRLEGEGGLAVFISATLRPLFREISLGHDVTE